MNIVGWIILGLLFGFIASILDYNTQAKGGLAGMLTVGTLGTLSGGYLANHLFGLGLNGFNMHSLIIGIAGSILLLIASKTLMKI